MRCYGKTLNEDENDMLKIAEDRMDDVSAWAAIALVVAVFLIVAGLAACIVYALLGWPGVAFGAGYAARSIKGG